MEGYGASPIEMMAKEAMLRGDLYCADFTYNADWLAGTGTALGANATANAPIQINADSDFVVQQMNIVAFTAADTPELNPDFLLNIVMAGSGRQIMNSPVHVMNYAGAFAGTNCLQAFGRLPMPLLLPANSSITNTLQNRSAQAQNFVQLSMRGFKVYYTGGNRRDIFHVL